MGELFKVSIYALLTVMEVVLGCAAILIVIATIFKIFSGGL